ncbi:MAG: aminotransferase class V-fold PLP-dependent enzyme, partial [Candidatus Nanohaloarchaea archaeon]|nr:aminotransferase class V-fold PLP-dependent enzyme [Candidatus Nanohaloarchaea archaeon]
EEIFDHDRKLCSEMVRSLEGMEHFEIYSPEGSCLVSFNIGDIHPHDVAEILNQEGIAVRSGHHCAQRQMRSMGINGTVRVSPYLYNTLEEVGRLEEALERVREVFQDD